MMFRKTIYLSGIIFFIRAVDWLVTIPVFVNGPTESTAKESNKEGYHKSTDYVSKVIHYFI